MKEPLVSIVVPIYNVEKYLERCIRSIVNQTYQNLEIILINDGSTDQSLDICKKYQTDKRITIVSRENKGLLYTRINGVKISHGEYLMFVDSDDFIDDNMIENMLNVIANENADMIKCGYKYIDGQAQIVKSVTNQSIEIVDDINNAYHCLISRCNLNSIWAELINNDLLKKHVDEINSEIAMGEDVEFNSVMYKYYHKIIYINQNFYNYQYDSNSMSHTLIYSKIKNKVFDLIKVYKKFILSLNNDVNIKMLSNKTLVTISNHLLSISNTKEVTYKEIYQFCCNVSNFDIFDIIYKNIEISDVEGNNRKETIMARLLYKKSIRKYSMIIYIQLVIKKWRVK